jgi:pimeloyl-ACP methyl ester carboxylesterase
MPEFSRPDGATIHYEVSGAGPPLLLIAPGGVSSQIEAWERSRIHPVRAFADGFRVIAMDQRHAGRSFAPAVPFSYEQTAADQLAVLDHAGAASALVMGGCIGCAHAFRLAHDAPGRIRAIVAQDPVGLDGATNSLATFFAMFDETMRVARADGMDAVVKAALEEPVFSKNRAAGPFAPRIHGDPAFREQIRAMRVEVYIALVVRFRDGVWPDRRPYFSVDESWMRTCATPILVLPGSDPFHPTVVARQICRDAPHARCLDVDCRSDAKLPATIESLRAFLRQQA